MLESFELLALPSEEQEAEASLQQHVLQEVQILGAPANSSGRDVGK